MKRVTKDEFYGPIYADRLNVQPSIVGGFPYTSVWRFLNNPGGPVYGKTVDRLNGGTIVTEYYISAESA